MGTDDHPCLFSDLEGLITERMNCIHSLDSIYPYPGAVTDDTRLNVIPFIPVSDHGASYSAIIPSTTCHIYQKSDRSE